MIRYRGNLQRTTFKEIRLIASREYFNPPKPYVTIFYPLIVTNNSKIDKLINDEVKESILSAEAISVMKGLDAVCLFIFCKPVKKSGPPLQQTAIFHKIKS